MKTNRRNSATQQAQAEALERANERVLLAERAAKAGSWDWDIRNGIYHWSDALFRLFGLDPATSVAGNDAWMSCLHPEDSEFASSRIGLALENRTPLFIQYRIVRPDGAIRWIDAYGDTTYGPDGTPIRMSGFCIDATDRVNLLQDKVALEYGLVELRRVEQQLRESEQRLELALMASGLGLWDYHVPSGLTKYDARWCGILGYALHEIEPVIDTWKKLVHPDDFAQVDADASAHLSGVTPVHQSEHRLRHKDGHWVWVLASGKIVERDAEERPVRLVGTILDISSQKRLSFEGLGLLQRIESLVRSAGSATNFPANGGERREKALASLSRRQLQILGMIASGKTS